jgi:hypothetical protein
MKVLELKGFKSLRALNSFSALVLGLKMLPSYAQESYESFYSKVQLMDDKDKIEIFKEAAMFVELQKEEVEALLSFCVDPNGIPYKSENLNNLSPDQIVDCIVAVCMEISKIKIDLITDDEKKNLKILA